MNDYGKLWIWPDGYYMTFNQFDGTTETWEGAGVAVFERDKMLLGQAAQMNMCRFLWNLSDQSLQTTTNCGRHS